MVLNGRGRCGGRRRRRGVLIVHDQDLSSTAVRCRQKGNGDRMRRLQGAAQYNPNNISAIYVTCVADSPWFICVRLVIEDKSKVKRSIHAFCRELGVAAPKRSQGTGRMPP
jgi:hypothetical protein